MEAAAPHGTASVASWDAAIAARLPAPASAVRALVHSRHRHVINVLLPGSGLIALASDELDDAPWTVRLADWAALEPLIGTSVLVSRAGLLLGAGQSARLDPLTRWFAQPVDLAEVPTRELAQSRDILRAAVREPTTPFGRASEQLIRSRTATLRARLLDDADGPALTAAVVALIGLGEGLTPSGDDIVTGLAFLSAQPGMHLGSRLGAMRRAVAEAAHRTTLLSAVTMAAAVDGRGRQRFHDLAAAIVEGRPESAVPAVLAIGHASGSDLLNGMSLALDVESELRAQRDNDKGYCNE